VWTHLAGVYDATAHHPQPVRERTLAATTTDTTPFDSTGVFVIGRGKSNGASTGYFAGNISDVQVYGQRPWRHRHRRPLRQQLHPLHGTRLAETARPTAYLVGRAQ